MKKYLFGLTLIAAMASCTDDYTDWAEPKTNAPEEAKTVGLNIAAANDIDIATAGDSVQLFVPTVTVADVAISRYVVTLSEAGVDEGTTVELVADNAGKVLKSELQDAVLKIFGPSPEERNLQLNIVGLTDIEGQTIKNVSTSTLKVTPYAPFIDTVYYLVGNIDGNTNKKVETYKVVNNGGNVYENPVFTVKLDPVEGLEQYEIKLAPQSAFDGNGNLTNTSIVLSALPEVTGASNSGSMSRNNEGGYIKFDAVEDAKFYNLTFDLYKGTYNVEAISFNQFIYFIGATDGWSTPDQKLESPAFDGIYTGYVYIADPNGWGVEFKFQKRAGDWADDSQLNSNNVTQVKGDFEKTGDNFKASLGEGVYFVEIDLLNSTITGTMINNMNLVGDFNGWNAGDDAQQMTWNPDEFCYEITGAGVTSNGWKFTANNDWAINLGGTTDELVGNGANLSAVGSTIKLYPTRKTSEKIYCTVE